MGRWHSIAARKASWDAKKSAVYAKIWKIIQMAAKKWSDPTMNPSLELALQKARYNWLPKDVVEKAILKWSGKMWSEDLQEVIFEWYWPWWSAILIKALTENTNRTSMLIKTALGKMLWSLWKQGSVSWKFSETGIFVVDWKVEKINDKWKMIDKISPLVVEEAEMEVMVLPVSDIEVELDKITLYCEKKDFSVVQDRLLEMWYHVVEWDLHFLTDDYISLGSADLEVLNKILLSLDEIDDISSVYHNVEE